tara:strand:+ start:62 stop:898 length:837 start_codon:yes stop_codon:yes gene_type:complete
MKIALGTVQWGLDYGIANKSGIPSSKELDAILYLANKSQISFLDTASAYGNAEERIGEQSRGRFNIITKIGSGDKLGSIEKQLHNSINNLKTDSVYACLFHDINELEKNSSMWKDLQYQKRKGLVEKVGYSLYHPFELEKLLRMDYIPDLIQIPFNLLDRRFEPYFKMLKKMDVEIHVRSIFLQGLLIDFEMMNSDRFVKWDSIWKDYQNWLDKSKLSPLEACISNALYHKEISKVIIGVENTLQLKQIVLASKKDIVEGPKSLITTDQELINPLSWL